MRATRRQQWTALPRTTRVRLVLAAGLSLVLGMAALLPQAASLRVEANLMRRASLAMAETIDAVRSERLERDQAIDPILDPNGTGLIGVEISPLTTTLGQLGAKRTTTNPNTAGLVTLLLLSAGVESGSTVAINASGSFPALILATLHAAQTLDATPLLIVSLSSSMYGANDETFALLDILDCYAGVGFEAVAATVGGSDDLGRGLDADTVSHLERAIDERGIPRLTPASLSDAVAQRMEILLQASSTGNVDCFVNIGGSWASMGTDSEILHIPPGLTVFVDEAPAPEGRGMIFEFLNRGTPVIHLLNIRDLAAEYGLPWDPSPLPEAGDGDLYLATNTETHRRVWPAYVWLGAIAALFVVPLGRHRTSAAGSDRPV